MTMKLIHLPFLFTLILTYSCRPAEPSNDSLSQEEVDIYQFLKPSKPGLDEEEQGGYYRDSTWIKLGAPTFDLEKTAGYIPTAMEKRNHFYGTSLIPFDDQFYFYSLQPRFQSTDESDHVFITFLEQSSQNKMEILGLFYYLGQPETFKQQYSTRFIIPEGSIS